MATCDNVCEIEAASAAGNRKEAEQGSHLTGHLWASAEFIWFRRMRICIFPDKGRYGFALGV